MMLNKVYHIALTGAVTMLACGALFATVDTEKQIMPAGKPAAAAATAAAAAKGEASPVDMPKVSEALGNFIGRNLKTPGVQFDMESIIKGIRAGADGKPSPMTDEEYEKAMVSIQQKAFSSLSDKNLHAANDYFSKMSGDKKIVIIEPGKLGYEIIKEGSGTVVEPHSNVQLNYEGKFIDGTVFGSSKETGGPVSISLDQTVPGFSKGITGMKEGEKRRIIVHPDLGYGTTGHLPPNSLLIFEVELVKANAPTSQLDDDNDSDDNDDDDYNDDDND